MLLNETQCPRCYSKNIVEVHGHYQCICGFYVSECCQGEMEQIIFDKPDPIEDLIDICDLLIFKNTNQKSSKNNFE